MNYSTHNLELLAVIFSLMIWRYDLYSATCQIFIDKRSFKYIYMQKE